MLERLPDNTHAISLCCGDTTGLHRSMDNGSGHNNNNNNDNTLQ